MENGSDFYGGGLTNRSKPQNDAVWDLWAPSWPTNNHHHHHHPTALFTSAGADGSISMYPAASQYEQLTLYNGRRGGGANFLPDSHLMCLKLGKRHYFGDNFPVTEREALDAEFSIGNRRVKPYVVGPSSAAAAVVPRCQVEGCYVSLVDAKDYHRRHKVCELHSKAPKVVVLGLEQRFCQQCSRFHVVSEFDESKRSCRRRLAGHNERRRKGNQDSVISRNSCHAEKLMIPSSATTGNAFSLLSSKSGESWNIYSSSDLSSRSSAALRELIAQHRGSILTRHNSIPNYDHQTQPNNFNATCNSFLSNHQFLAVNGDRFQDDGNNEEGAVTLNLMQAPTASAAFGFFSTNSRDKDKEGEGGDEECSVLWNSWQD